MKYMGSKNRIAKYILPIILKDRKENQYFISPFCGGGNMIDKVDGNRIATDNNEYLIEALKLIRDNPESLPKTNKLFSEEDYKNIKNNKDKNKALYGYVGFALSYAGKWFGGWCRDKERKRDYVKEAYNNAIKQSIKLKNVKLKYGSFDSFDYPKNSIIYCDPPYKNTTKYNTTFDYNNFYKWCRNMKEIGHTIFISEYYMPDDFKCVWQKEIVSSLTKDTGSKKGIEKLFTL